MERSREEKREKIRYETWQSKDKSCKEAAPALQPPRHSQNCVLLSTASDLINPSHHTQLLQRQRWLQGPQNLS